MSVESGQIASLLSALLTLSAWSICYVLGGRRKKWVRRWLGSLLLVSGSLWIAWQFQPLMLASAPAYIAALHLGYGGTRLWQKLHRRALYGAAVGLASLPLLWPRWELAVVQSVFAVIVSVYQGVRNPQSAVGEEGAIAIGMVWMVPLAMIQ